MLGYSLHLGKNVHIQGEEEGERGESCYNKMQSKTLETVVWRLGRPNLSE